MMIARRRARATFALRIVDRLAIAKALGFAAFRQGRKTSAGIA